MGFISASMTMIIGYFAIEFIKKNKKNLAQFPIICEFLDKNEVETEKVSNDVYLIVLAFALKDFIF